MRKRLLTVVLAVVWFASPALTAGAADAHLDSLLRARARAPQGFSRVILRTREGRAPDALLLAARATRIGHLSAIGADVLEIRDSDIAALARDPRVLSVSADRPVRLAGAPPTAEDRMGAATLAGWMRQALGIFDVDGTGVTIAMVDSGITGWHDDLTGPGRVGQRVIRFVDFVQHRTAAYDDFGHGTHVAGILAGNGTDSEGTRAGVAPGATLVSLKVLDANGDGLVSDVIAAIDYAIEHRAELNIRIMNLSVAAAPTESFSTDPLTLAARRAVNAGIVVVAAAGNLGRAEHGVPAYGGIAAPGNAPWVLTVGASTPNGTADRSDDGVAAFSSRGPTRFDRAAKPDLVAPGVGIESLSEPGSTLYQQRPQMRVWGTVDTAAPPYFRMSGTSMAAPVVSGTVALMLQANPSLTPNAVKAILEYTAEWRGGWEGLAQGAGLLNARGAVALARHFDDQTALDADTSAWSRHVTWGNTHVDGAALAPTAPAWSIGTVWGADADASGRLIAWSGSTVHEGRDQR